MFRIYWTGFIIVLLLTAIAYIEWASTPIQDNIKTQQWAVVVGIGNYEYLDADTCYADDDAKNLSALFEPIFGNEHVNLLVDSNATKSGFRNAVYEWLDPREDEDDLVLLFLAGHGNHEYLQLYDSLKESHCNDISSPELSMWLDTLESQNIVVIMDFCEGGSYGDSISGIGRIVITGCTGHEKCWQEDAYRHGIFSYYLIEAFDHLDTVDTNDNHEISAEELFEYVKFGVASEFECYPPPSPQHPHISNHHGGDLILFTYSPD